VAKQTAIAWCDSTFNPWWGCTKVSPACDHCYAEAFAKRVGQKVWGAGAGRRYFGDKHWREPLAWNDKATGPHRVFCASMADVFDNEVAQHHRERLWTLIRETPRLTWLLLTKRIGNAPSMLPDDFGPDTYPHVWIGMTVVTQEEVHRDIGKLLAVPARVRWLSIEPQLEEIRIPDGVQWVVTGGESGSKARPYNVDWARSIIRQCREQGVTPFVKQLGSEPFDSGCTHLPVDVMFIKDRAGADPSEWPQELRVREWPDA
jgi:protein gp37